MSNIKLKTLEKIEYNVIISTIDFKNECNYNIVPNLTMEQSFDNILGPDKAKDVRKALLRCSNGFRDKLYITEPDNKSIKHPISFSFNDSISGYYLDLMNFPIRWIIIYDYDKRAFKEHNLYYLTTKHEPNNKYVKQVIREVKSIANSFLSHEDVVEVRDEIRKNMIRKMVLHYSRINGFKYTHPFIQKLPDKYPSIRYHKFSKFCYDYLYEYKKSQLFDKESNRK